MFNQDRYWPRYAVYSDGILHGAYLTTEHAQEVCDRLEKKGKRTQITDQALEWYIELPKEDEKKVK